MDIVTRVEAWGRALTVQELASVISVSSKTLYRQIKAHKIPAMYVGGQIRLDPAKTADWLRSRIK